jgi:GNAT superfamily N-acetyltransferase
MPAIEVVRTYLELTAPPPSPRIDFPADVSVRREDCGADRYRALYGAVGRAHHWRDRDAWSDEDLRDFLARPDVAVWILRVGGRDAGYFELRRHDDQSVEIAYFGVAAPFQGRGLGRLLLVRAVEEAWRWNATRVWLHTCTLDHPAALPNYVARGFRPYRSERYFARLTDERPGDEA